MGDLITGACNQSAIATLVNSPPYVALVQPPMDHTGGIGAGRAHQNHGACCRSIREANQLAPGDART
jgi:hypothetical protein